MIGLSFSSLRVTGTSECHPNDSKICSELPFTANLKGLSTFHSSALEADKFIPSNSLPSSKKDSDIDKSLILVFKYCKDENHSSFFDASSFALRDKHILCIAGESFGNSSSYVSGWLDSRDNFSFTCFFLPVNHTTFSFLLHNYLHYHRYRHYHLKLEACIGTV